MILAVAIAIAVGIRDARERVIPNTWSALLGIVGFGFQLLRLLGWRPALPWEAAVSLQAMAPVVCLASAVMVLACGVALETLHRVRTGSPGMGLGDVKYLAAWTLVLGPVSIACFSAACLLGALVALARGKRDFALGPWIGACCVAWLVLCCW